MVSDPILREIVCADFIASIHRAKLTLTFNPYGFHMFVEVDLKQAFTDNLERSLLI